MTPTKEGLLKWVDDYAAAMDLPPRETLILTKFAAYADADMAAWAKVDTLAKQGRSSERKVQYVLRDFEAAGVLRRTGEVHRLSHSTRSVPIYAFAGYLETLAEGEPAPVRMGARRAPIEAHGCTDGGGMGAQGVHPQEEFIEQTSPSGEGAGARAIEDAFREVERAFPKRGLGFTHRARARSVFGELAAEGLDLGLLAGAARAYAADRTVKRQDLGLDHWLADRKYRGWWPADGEAGAVDGGGVWAGPVGLWDAVAAAKGAAFAGATLGRAAWDAAAGAVIPATTWAHGQLAALAAIFETQGVALLPPSNGGVVGR